MVARIMRKLRILRDEGGDTLIEVTLALAILGFVLLSSTAVGTAAYRTGQTARERTQVAAVAQEQMEALRSFRDNHTWLEFRGGSGSCPSGPLGYCGIDQVQNTTCSWQGGSGHCFHMEPLTIGANKEWVPVAGPRPAQTGDVPTQFIGIEVADSAAALCRYDFTLHYQFTPLGGGTPAANRISTRLANLKFEPSAGVCPAT
jgi:type II secretory pathway pseudopilin PulG